MPDWHPVPLLASLLLAGAACTTTSSPEEALWRARLDLRPDGQVEVHLRFPGAVARLLPVPGTPRPRDLALRTTGGWQPLAFLEGEVPLPPGCRDPEVRYRFLPPPEAGGDVLLLPAGGCLLQAAAGRPAVVLVAAPELPAGWTLASAWFPALPHEGGGGHRDAPEARSRRLPARSLPRAPWAALTRLPVQHLEVADSTIDILFLEAAPDPWRQDVLDWAEAAARDVSTWLGRLPVPHLLLRVHPGRGRGTFGRTWGLGGARIDAWVGAQATPESLAADWILAHEISHLALPLLDRKHHWLEEGLATYLESLVRHAGGGLAEEAFWQRLVRGLPLGQPGPGDRGLDHTRSWGRTYWGGALYWFVADLEIRRQSHGRRHLGHVLAAFRARGWSMAVTRPVAEVLAAADRASGSTVFTDLHDAWRSEPATVDLDGIWRSLGIRLAGDRILLDEAAPEAPLRHGFRGATVSSWPR